MVDIAKRKIPPKPWEEGEKIPWNDPEFSKRMLQIHLSQENDWASRRSLIIREHVNWIGKNVVKFPVRVLDLACGPGLYTALFAKGGCSCTGIDFSPASIEYAKKESAKGSLNIEYLLSDIRSADYGQGFDLAVMIFGEFNVFRQNDAEAILSKIFRSLNNGGKILIEVHTFDEVRRQGNAMAYWQANQDGLFADYPHLQLEEYFWDPEYSTATTRYLIVGLNDRKTVIHASTMQAYTDDQYREMLVGTGFLDFKIYENMSESKTEFDGRLQTIVAKKNI